MSPAKWLMAAGAVIFVLGALWFVLERFTGGHIRPGHLPGDIRIERERVRFYFPLMTSLLLSLLLSLVLYLFRKR